MCVSRDVAIYNSTAGKQLRIENVMKSALAHWVSHLKIALALPDIGLH